MYEGFKGPTREEKKKKKECALWKLPSKRILYSYLYTHIPSFLTLYSPKKHHQSINYPLSPQTQTQTQMKQAPLYRASAGPNSGLTRYGSAPGSLLTSLADSVISEGRGGFHSVIGSESPATLPMTRFFPGPGESNNNTTTTNNSRSCLSSSEPSCGKDPVGPNGLQRSNYPVGAISGAGGENNNNQKAAGAGSGDGSHLLRQSSSPAGFFSHLLVDNGQLSLDTRFDKYTPVISYALSFIPEFPKEHVSESIYV